MNILHTFHRQSNSLGPLKYQWGGVHKNVSLKVVTGNPRDSLVGLVSGFAPGGWMFETALPH